MNCFDAGMISIILTVILYSNFRHAISNVNKVVFKQINNFLFVTNNPVIFFQDKAIGLLTFNMPKGAESRPEFARVFGVCCLLREVSFYFFSPKRGPGITLSFVCLLICIRRIARKCFPQFVAMPDRRKIAILHCSVI